MVLVIGNHNRRDDVRKTTEKLDGLAGRGGNVARDSNRRHIVLWFVYGLRKLCVTKSELWCNLRSLKVKRGGDKVEKTACAFQPTRIE